MLDDNVVATEELERLVETECRCPHTPCINCSERRYIEQVYGVQALAREVLAGRRKVAAADKALEVLLDEFLPDWKNPAELRDWPEVASALADWAAAQDVQSHE